MENETVMDFNSASFLPMVGFDGFAMMTRRRGDVPEKNEVVVVESPFFAGASSAVQLLLSSSDCGGPMSMVAKGLCCGDVFSSPTPTLTAQSNFFAQLPSSCSQNLCKEFRNLTIRRSCRSLPLDSTSYDELGKLIVGLLRPSHHPAPPLKKMKRGAPFDSKRGREAQKARGGTKEGEELVEGHGAPLDFEEFSMDAPLTQRLRLESTSSNEIFQRFFTDALRNSVQLSTQRSFVKTTRTFAMKHYDDRGNPKNGPPTIVHVHDVEGGDPIIICRCHAADLSRITMNRNKLGMEGGNCWHERILEDARANREIALNRVESLGFGYGNGNGSGSGSISIIPGNRNLSCMYVFSELEKVKAAVVGVSENRMSCLVCSVQSIKAAGAGPSRLCPHINSVKDIFSDAEEDDLEHMSPEANQIARRVAGLFGGDRVCPQPPASHFNITNGTYEFPSYTFDIEQREFDLRGNIAPLIPKVPSSNSRSACAGGGGDCQIIRLKVQVKHLQGVGGLLDDVIRNGFVTTVPHCQECHEEVSFSELYGGGNGNGTGNGNGNGDDDDECENRWCSHCHLSPEDGVRICNICATQTCLSCSVHVVFVGDTFLRAFPELKAQNIVGNCPPGDVIEAIKDALDNASLIDGPMNFFLPKLPGNVCLCGAGEYSVNGLELEGESLLHTLTHVKQVDIYKLHCPNQSDDCVIYYSGHEDGMLRFTSGSAFSHEVFYLAMELSRTMGSSSMSVVGMLAMVYRLSGAPGNQKFAEYKQYQDALFAFLSLQQRKFNRRCVVCPPRMTKAGMMYNDCRQLGWDGQGLKCLRNPRHRILHVPRPGAPTADCRKRRPIDRLVIPGGSGTKGVFHRTFLRFLARSILGRKLSKEERELDGKEEEFRASFMTAEEVKDYQQCAEVLLRVHARRVRSNEDGTCFFSSEFENSLAGVALLIANNAAEISQVMPHEMVPYIEDVLKKSDEGCLEIQSLQRDALLGISPFRRSLLTLVMTSALSPQDPNCAFFEANANELGNETGNETGNGTGTGTGTIDRTGHRSGNGSSMHRATSSLLKALIGAEQAEWNEARRATNVPDYTTPELREDRNKPDPSSGVFCSLTKYGGQLRDFPEFLNAPRDRKGSTLGQECEKRQWTNQKWKRDQFSNDGTGTLVCMASGLPIAVMFFDTGESPAHLSGLLSTHMPKSNRDITVVVDTPCMTSAYARTRLPRFNRRVKYLCDRMHVTPHKCAEVTNMDDFPTLDRLNSPLVEQWHALTYLLKTRMKHMSAERAMFLLLVLQDDRADVIANRLGAPDNWREWPESDDDEVSVDSTLSSEADEDENSERDSAGPLSTSSSDSDDSRDSDDVPGEGGQGGSGVHESSVLWRRSRGWSVESDGSN